MPEPDSSPMREPDPREPVRTTGTGGRPPFVSMTGVRPRLIDRLLRRRPAANAFVELNNLLAGARDLRDVTAGDVEKICRSHGLDVRDTFAARCRNLYRDYLIWCLVDRQLSEDELACLAHLADLLRLDPDTAAAIHRTGTRHVYLRSVEDVLADGTVSDEEREFLLRLSEQLDIPAGTAENIFDMRRRQLEVRKPPRPRAARDHRTDA